MVSYNQIQLNYNLLASLAVSTYFILCIFARTASHPNCCSLYIHQCILDRLEGAEAVGGGGGPLLNNSSMKLWSNLFRSSGTHSSTKYRLSFCKFQTIIHTLHYTINHIIKNTHDSICIFIKVPSIRKTWARVPISARC